MKTKKKIVAERKKEMGYGLRIRQCHDCAASEIKDRAYEYNRAFDSYYCLEGGFVVQKTATCKKWR